MSAEILRQIPDAHDRHILWQLCQKYALLRVRLSSPPQLSQPVQPYTQELRGRIAQLELRDSYLTGRTADLEAENAELRASNAKLREDAEMVEQWKGWAERNIPRHERLLQEHSELQSRCEELERVNSELITQVQALLVRCHPANKVLYQAA